MNNLRNDIKILCEIMQIRDPQLFDEIRELNLSIIQNRTALSDQLMGIIRAKLIEWNNNIQSFQSLTSKENSLSTMDYLIETIQSDFSIETEKIKSIKEIIERNSINLDNLYDCLEMIPELLDILKKKVTEYNLNIERRVKVYKPLQEFTYHLYKILIMIKTKLEIISDRKSQNLHETLLEYMKRLLNQSIVIKDYPPRTITKGTGNQNGTQFKTTIKCLIESEVIFCKVEIQPFFLSEGDFNDYICNEKLKNDCLIEYGPRNFKSNIWELKNMRWNPPQRLVINRSKDDLVTNQKAIIMFKFKAFANPNLFEPFPVNISLYSDTVVSIVNKNQEIKALMTLFWDDYFRQDRARFLECGTFCCQDSVSIDDLIDAISRYFEKETSRSLTLANREFLSMKLPGTLNYGMTFHHFGYQPMTSEVQMSFGMWAMSIIKLLKITGVYELWTNNLIEGFLKKDANSIFLSCLPGTFALRFCETTPRICVLLKTPNNNLDAWDPFGFDECRNRNLCEQLMDFHELKYIRSTNGECLIKEEVLSAFIPNKQPAHGYTERGQLSRLLCSNIYLNPSNDDEDNNEIMNNDDYIGFTDDGSQW